MHWHKGLYLIKLETGTKVKLFVILLAYVSINFGASAQGIGNEQVAVLKVLEQVFEAMEAGDNKAFADI